MRKITSGQSNFTKGRIAAAHGRQSLYFIMGCSFPIKIAPSRIWVAKNSDFRPIDGYISETVQDRK